MGPAQADRALDDSNLAVRIRHRSSRLFNAVQMVSSTSALTAVASVVRSGLPTGCAISTCIEHSAPCSDEPVNQSDVKILRSTAI